MQDVPLRATQNNMARIEVNEESEKIRKALTNTGTSLSLPTLTWVYSLSLEDIAKPI